MRQEESTAHIRLRSALQSVGKKKPLSNFPAAFHTVVWMLMRAFTRITQLEKLMDKKMAKVTKQMKTAEGDVKKGQPMAAVAAIKGAVKKNVKLTKEDRDVRDPEIKAYKVMKKKGC
jgi:hypothetical protein